MNGLTEGERTAHVPPDWGVARSLMLSNPALVCDDVQLLQALGLRSSATNIIEFGPAILARLEAAKAREVSARHEVESLARANHAAQIETHALVLDLLGSRNNADLACRVNEGVQRRFGLEAGVLAAEGAAPVGWRTLPMGLLDYVLGPNQIIAIGACTGGAEIFGDVCERVHSVALVRISVFDPPRAGVLAFGSADPLGFSVDMGVELIAFLAKVVERTAERWPLLI